MNAAATRGSGYAYIWEYVVRPEFVDDFKKAYGPDGEWASLFERAGGYLRTELLQDSAAPQRFFTIDYWESEDAWEAFRATMTSDFEALDERCEAFTLEEREIARLHPIADSTRIRRKEDSMAVQIDHPTVKALVEAINAGDLEALDKVFNEDVIMEYPQSGERIRGGQNRREIYKRFPSLPKVTPYRVTGNDDMQVLEASLDYGDGDPFQCVFIFEMRDGKISGEYGYWAKPFPAPDWRATWVERM